jgi:hypothetical protein
VTVIAVTVLAVTFLAVTVIAAARLKLAHFICGAAVPGKACDISTALPAPDSRDGD